MRVPVLALFLAALAFSAESPEPAAPRTIPKDRKEDISRALLQLQFAQVQLEKLLTPEIRKAQDNVQQQNQALMALYEQLRKEFSAPPQCYPNALDKTWVQLLDNGQQVPCKAERAKPGTQEPRDKKQ
jgi:hypothetical protein